MKFNVTFLDVINSEERVRLLKHLLEEDIPRSERELSAIAGVSHMLVNRFMKNLYGLNLVVLERVGKASVWRVNQQSYAYKVLSPMVKVLAQLPRPIEHLKNTIRKVLSLSGVKQVILFGSIAQGTEVPSSDIDLFVLLSGEVVKRKFNKSLDRLSDQCLTLYGNSLSPYILTEMEFKKKKALPVLRRIKKGIRIYP